MNYMLAGTTLVSLNPEVLQKSLILASLWKILEIPDAGCSKTIVRHT